MSRIRHRNGGLRKRCSCSRKAWPRSGHPWHMNFTPHHGPDKGREFRLSLDREVGHRILSKSEAETVATNIRAAILAGTFRAAPAQAPAAPATITFRAFADVWKEKRGSQLVRPRDNNYRIAKILAFVVPGREGLTFGDLSLDQIRTGDIEAFRDARKAEGLSACTVNHDLKLLRKMFNWGIRRGYLERTPFKIGTEPAISLDTELPRSRRFENEDDEQRLLDACGTHLRAVVIALLDTACRLGEVLGLQWRDANLERRELTIPAVKAKTRTARIVPISTRLLATLDMRKHDPAGNLFGPDAYVFGNEVGDRVRNIRNAWENAVLKAHGCEPVRVRGKLSKASQAQYRAINLRPHDLRHEAGSRFDEAGVSTNYVSKILGHASLTTTTRYLNTQRRGLHLAMEKFEESRRLADEQRRRRADALAHGSHKQSETAPAFVPDLNDTPAGKRLLS